MGNHLVGRAIAVCAALGGMTCGTAAAAPAPARTAAVDSHLLAVAAAGTAGRGVARGPQPDGVQVRGGRVLVELQVAGRAADAVGALESLGMAVTGTARARPFDMVEGWIDPERLDEAAALPAAETIDAARGTTTDFGAVTTQGDARLNGPAARALGPTGAGQKVGIVSDSFDTATGAVAGTDPAKLFSGAEFSSPVKVFLDDTGETDEGRAMGEIIQDVAPGAQLSFASANTSVQKSGAINRLRTEGMTVIADDVASLSQPFFQDGVVAQAANAARAAGIAYFASAGNRGRQSWEGTFTNAGGFNDFDPGAGVDTTQTLATIPNNGDATLYFQWAEPWGASVTDLDVSLVRVSDGTVLDSSTTHPTLPGGNPSEFLGWTNTTGAPVQVGLRILRNAGSGTPLMKWIWNGDGFTTVGGTRVLPAEFATNSDAINPDAASATGVMAVAAVPASDSGRDTPEPFSSRGPKIRLFPANAPAGTAPVAETRAKPNVTSSDCVATSVATPHDFTTFCGTSAATPHAAGVAALLRSASPAMDVADVYAIMQNPANAVACTSSAPVNDCGGGFMLADKIVGSLDRTPPTITPSITPATPDGTNGWYRTAPTVAFAVADGESTIVAQSGCGSTPVTAQGTVTLTCTAQSGGGSATLPLTLKRDSIAPSVPVIGGIVDGTTYPQNEVPAAVSCTATDGGSGLAGCVVNGGTVTTRGPHTLAMTATDNAGNTATGTATYTVGAPIDRIRSPLITALFRRRPTIAVLTTTGYKVLATGVPNGTLRITVKRGPVPLATGLGVARNGVVAVTVRTTNPVKRKLIRRSRSKKVTVAAVFLATSGSTARSAVTRVISALG